MVWAVNSGDTRLRRGAWCTLRRRWR